MAISLQEKWGALVKGWVKEGSQESMEMRLGDQKTRRTISMRARAKTRETRKPGGFLYLSMSTAAGDKGG